MYTFRIVRTFVLAAAVALVPSARAAAEGQPAAAAHHGEALARLRQLVKSEPTIQEVQRAALRFYQLEPERIAGLMHAARVKALLP